MNEKFTEQVMVDINLEAVLGTEMVWWMQLRALRTFKTSSKLNIVFDSHPNLTSSLL